MPNKKIELLAFLKKKLSRETEKKSQFYVSRTTLCTQEINFASNFLFYKMFFSTKFNLRLFKFLGHFQNNYEKNTSHTTSIYENYMMV